jgi:nucleoside-diphosphate-sugar epimerase
MTRVLLLGATGFLGQHVHRRLTMDGIDLVTVGRTGPVDVRLDLATASVRTVTDIVCAAEAAAVVNCTGATDPEPTRLVVQNVVAVATLVAAMAAAAQKPGPRACLIHIGSAAEYGFVPGSASVTETTDTRPITPYGVTKLAGTTLVAGAAQHGLTATVLRVFNLIGPGTPAVTLPGRLVSELQAAREMGRPALVASLEGHRDFVDVRDVAAAVAAAVDACLSRPSTVLPPILNIGSGRSTALRALAAEVVTAAGGGTILESPTQPGSPRSGGVTWQRAGIAMARKALGWQPVTDFRASVRDMWLAAGQREPAPAAR